MVAKVFDRFIHGKSRSLRRNLKQNSAGLAEINGMKIEAVDHRRNVETEIDQLFSPAQLFFVVCTAKRNVMHCAGGIDSELSVALLD